jgi:hypothetical protein
LGQLDADWIYNNPEDAEFLQQQRLKSRILAGKREFIGDFSDRWLKIKALRVLGWRKFMEPGKIWTQESPEVLELLKRCKKKSVAKLLGHPGKTKPIAWLNRLLKILGYKLIAKRKNQNGVLHWEYSYIPEKSRPQNWDELARFTGEKYAQKICQVKEAQILAAQVLEANPVPPILDTNIGGIRILPDITTEAPIFQTEVEATSLDLPVPEVPIANSTGWVSRSGKWVAAKVIGWCSEGTRYRILYQTKCGEWSEALAFPSQMRWGQIFYDPPQ